MARTAVVTAAPPEPKTLGLDDLIARLFPEPGQHLIRLCAESRSGRVFDWYFKRSAQSPERARWCWPPFSPAMSADTPSLVVSRNRDVEPRLSPLLYQAPAATSTTPAKSTTVWCVFKVGALANGHHKTPYGLAVDPASEAAAIERLHALKPGPSVILAEGFRVSALWILTVPIADLGQVERVNLALARKLGGDLSLADPRVMTLPIPGERCVNVFPSRAVSAVMLADHRAGLEDLSEVVNL